MKTPPMIHRTSLCLLGVLGLTLFASPVVAQVFDLGSSDAALFDNVISLPADSNIGHNQSIGGDDSTTQLNISAGGSVRTFLDANSGSEVNISGGAIGIFADARSGSEVNISGGSVGGGFRAFSGSVVNISGGRIGDNFHAFGDSKINLLGSGFVLDGVSLDGSLTMNVPFTIDDRDVILSGRLADGSPFSFDLNTIFPAINGQDLFLPNAMLTVTRVSTDAPSFAQTITQIPLLTFDGDSAFAFGRSVSNAGDVNGDGVADLIVGSNGDNSNGFFVGRTQVFSGVDGSVLYTFDATSAFDNFGGAVSGAGDVNGDGFADLIVGAFSADNNGTDSGRAQVFSGVDGSVLYNFDGNSAGDWFGISVSGAGDVNGDGFDDVIVGAQRDDDNGPFSGSATVFSGVDGSVLFNFDGDSDFEFFGTSVSGAGDVNGDGFADVIVGIPEAANGGSEIGSARVFSGVDGSVLYNFIGDSDFDRFGSSVSGAGDVNGDGFADLIVGAPFTDLHGRDNGSARVLSGVDGSVLYNFDGDTLGDNFGASVSGAGDVNGDGFADLIVGAPLDDNDGADSGSAQVFSGSDGSVLYNFDGDSASDQFGVSVSGAGDVNGDGVADFVVGAGVGLREGYVRLFVSQIAPVILGDCDQDGDVDFEDIAPFIEVLASGSFLAQADCNQDGEVTFEDIAPFIGILAGN